MEGLEDKDEEGGREGNHELDGIENEVKGSEVQWNERERKGGLSERRLGYKVLGK